MGGIQGKTRTCTIIKLVLMLFCFIKGITPKPSGFQAAAFSSRKLLSEEDLFVDCQFDRCDLRVSYCDHVHMKCDSCEARCGPVALARDPAGTPSCQEICKEYYAHTTTTPRPTPTPQVNIHLQEVKQLGDKIEELSKLLDQHGDQIGTLSNSVGQQGDQIKKQFIILCVVAVVGGITLVGLIVLAILLVINKWKPQKAKSTQPEAAGPLGLGHSNNIHNSNHSITDSVPGAAGMDEQSHLLSEEVPSSSSRVQCDVESETSVKQPDSGTGSENEVHTQQNEAALVQTAKPVDGSFGLPRGQPSSIAVAQPAIL